MGAAEYFNVWALHIDHWTQDAINSIQGLAKWIGAQDFIKLGQEFIQSCKHQLTHLSKSEMLVLSSSIFC